MITFDGSAKLFDQSMVVCFVLDPRQVFEQNRVAELLMQMKDGTNFLNKTLFANTSLTLHQEQ